MYKRQPHVRGFREAGDFHGHAGPYLFDAFAVVVDQGAHLAGVRAADEGLSLIHILTYTNRNVKVGEIRSVGSNVTITLNNSSMHFDGEIPAVDGYRCR